MDYRKTAQEIYDAIGGKENIVSAAHCATRLRLVIGDNTKCSKQTIENVDGVKGTFEAAGQFQIILGTGVVNKVFDEFIAIAGIQAGTKEDVKQAAAAQQNLFKRMIKTLGDIFVPIIPAIVASGLLMGLLEGLCNVFPAMAESGTYQIIHLFSNAAFVFLPILIAMSAAKVFGANIYLGAVVGMIMIHTDLMNAWSVAGADSVPTASVWFGLYDINLVGYQGHVIPIVISVFILALIEKKLHKIVPEIIDLFVTPLVSVLVTGYLALTMIGPVFGLIETWVLNGAQYLISLPLGIGGCIVGAAYAPTVVAGVHHMYNAIEAGLLSSIGENTWMPIATAANIGQAGAALAVALKTKNNKIKSMALPASLSAFLGITEPAIFGVNIRFFKSFVAGCIGGACGGLVAGITGIGASAYGITGIFGLLITTNCTLQYVLVMVVAVAVGFTISYITYKDEEPAVAPAGNVTGATEVAGSAAVTGATEVAGSAAVTGVTEVAGSAAVTGVTAATVDCTGAVLSSLAGKMIPLSEVKDETFASGVLGEGVGIEPAEGIVKAPVNGVISSIFDTKHAVGITGDNGVELLIHIGVNTVELNGQFYEAHVAEGDRIAVGDTLITFEPEKIKAAGYDVTTPVIVVNSGDLKEVAPKAPKNVTVGEEIIAFH